MREPRGALCSDIPSTLLTSIFSVGSCDLCRSLIFSGLRPTRWSLPLQGSILWGSQAAPLDLRPRESSVLTHSPLFLLLTLHEQMFSPEGNLPYILYLSNTGYIHILSISTFLQKFFLVPKTVSGHRHTRWLLFICCFCVWCHRLLFLYPQPSSVAWK